MTHGPGHRPPRPRRPAAGAPRATARYMAPVSRKSRPSRSRDGLGDGRLPRPDRAVDGYDTHWYAHWQVLLEAGVAGGDRFPPLDHRLPGCRHGRHRHRHGHPVVAVRARPSRPGERPAAGDDEAVGRRLHVGAHGGELARHRRHPVGLLHPQLAGAGEGGRALGQRRRHRQHRDLVDQAGDLVAVDVGRVRGRASSGHGATAPPPARRRPPSGPARRGTRRWPGRGRRRR